MDNKTENEKQTLRELGNKRKIIAHNVFFYGYIEHLILKIDPIFNSKDL